MLVLMTALSIAVNNFADNNAKIRKETHDPEITNRYKIYTKNDVLELWTVYKNKT